jgi:hypothetical protein
MIGFTKLFAPLWKIGQIFWEASKIVGAVTIIGMVLHAILTLYMRDAHPWVRALVIELITVITTLGAVFWRSTGSFIARSTVDKSTVIFGVTTLLIVVSHIVMWVTVWRRGTQNQINWIYHSQDQMLMSSEAARAP